MLAALCEAWKLLHTSLGMSNDEIGKIFEKWNAEGELRGTYLGQIGAEVCQRRKTLKGDGRGEGVGDHGHILNDVLDKVVQDDDNTEGTGFWSVMDAASRHVSSPTIAAGHFMHVASGNREQRLKVADMLKLQEPQKINTKVAFIEDLRGAVYASFLCSFAQGLELIARASKDEGWNVDLAICIHIWRAGCIVQSDHIADMLEPILSPGAQIMNVKLIKEVAEALHDSFAPLKKVVLKAIEVDAYVPSLSASLEYLKYSGGTKLPTQFMEAQIDFFGAHAFDQPGVRGEDPGKAKTGSHHYEWRPA